MKAWVYFVGIFLCWAGGTAIAVVLTVNDVSIGSALKHGGPVVLAAGILSGVLSVVAEERGLW